MVLKPFWFEIGYRFCLFWCEIERGLGWGIGMVFFLH